MNNTPSRPRSTPLKPLFIALTSVGLMATTPAFGATFMVTKLADTSDGTCDADCSLREAIAAANGNGDSTNSIGFTAGLTGTITLTSGEIAITKHLIMAGPGADQLAIDGNNASRIFNIADGIDADGPDGDTDPDPVAIAYLTLRNGNSTTGPGGCIHSQSSLFLMQSIVTGCSAVDAGGGIFVGDQADPYTSSGPFNKYASLALDESTVSGNSVVCDGATSNAVNMEMGCSGGGIYSYHGNVTKYSLVRNNTVTVSGNFTSSLPQAGGGISTRGSNSLQASTISGNQLTGDANVSDADGGTTLHMYRLGAGVVGAQNLVFASTLSGNTMSSTNSTAEGYLVSAGGGLATTSRTSAPLTWIVDSTISGNSASSVGIGGGVFMETDDPDAKYFSLLSQSTVTGNTGQSGVAFYVAYDYGPAINSSIIANTQGGTDLECINTFGCELMGVLIQDSLVESRSLAGATLQGNTILTSDPQLGPLANNNSTMIAGVPGVTGAFVTNQTHAIGTTSPAYNQGNDTMVLGGNIPFDQRYFPRVVNGRADIGAYEYQGAGNAQPIPALGPWALGLLSGLLGLLGWRRRR